jgi:hypothetical protein
MVRPIIEYGGALFDKSPDIHTKPLDKVQREAGLVCTGAYKHTKNVKLMEVLGWDTLEVRREFQRTTLMYKIQNNLAPPYLADICPPLVGEVSRFNLRNAENIALPPAKATSYVNSFIPSAIRLWNGLNKDIKQSDTVDSFKYRLRKNKGITKNKLYPKFNGSKAVNHTRMRLGLSGLKAQRYDYNHVDSPKCDFCGARKEDPMHYFLQCRTFGTMRTILLHDVENLYRSKHLNLDLSRTIVKKELVQHLLCGDSRLNERENRELFLMVQQFISSSKRF